MSFRPLLKSPASGQRFPLTRFNPVFSRRISNHREAFISSRNYSSTIVNESSLTVPSLGTSFPYVWLRDSCQSADSVHPSTSQKLHRTSDVPLDIKPTVGGVKSSDDGIQIEWTTGHKSFYTFAFLERHASIQNLSKFHRDVSHEPWDASSISKVDELFLPYASLQQPSGLLAAVTQIAKYGILFVSGVPNRETSNETCELRSLAEHFGEIRHTFYGQVWDVKNVRNSRNIAYTNLDLGLHMDLLYDQSFDSFCSAIVNTLVVLYRYFQHPPRYQVLHCLRNRVVGGTSIFVDALRAACMLRSTHPTDFEVLATTPVAFHYINDGHHLHYEHPTIELADVTPLAQTTAADANKRPVAHINYSPPFQPPLLLADTPPEFYPALARFAALLDDPSSTYNYTLQEGDAVLFDNRRVLHARTAFEDIESDKNEGETNRWLKGCYLEADALLDRGRVLETKAGQR